MAQRICRQITKQTNRIKQAVTQYNILDKNLNSRLPVKLSLSDAYDVQSDIWSHLGDSKQDKKKVAPYIKRTLIDLHHRIQRCDEEIVLLTSEMKNTVLFMVQKRDVIRSALKELTPQSSSYNRGLCSLLKGKLLNVDASLKHTHGLFQKAGVDTVDSSEIQENPQPVIHLIHPQSSDSESEEEGSTSGSESEGSEHDDYDPLNELCDALDEGTYEEPLSSAESDVDTPADVDIAAESDVDTA